MCCAVLCISVECPVFYSQWLLPSHDSYHWVVLTYVVRQMDQFSFCSSECRDSMWILVSFHFVLGILRGCAFHVVFCCCNENLLV